VLVELQVDNRDGALKPGAFAQVNFKVRAGKGNGVSLPGSAILYGNAGPSVAVVGRDGQVVVKPVTIARDEGATVMLSSGVTPNERVIDAPPDAIRNGDRVRVEASASAAPKGGKGGANAG
jgi:multidrug efflux pump subunit AcrA (membrane-fusion protein)